MVRRLMASGLAMSLLVAACNVVSASGNVISQTREVAGFSAVEVSSGLAVNIRVQSGAESSVVVRYDDNVIDRVITRVAGEALVIDLDGSVNFNDGDRSIDVVMPRLGALDARGGSAIVVAGSVDSYSLNASGGAAVDAAELRAMRVAVDASGGASVSLFATAGVTGDASGGAAVQVLGSPTTVTVETSGGASVDAGP